MGLLFIYMIFLSGYLSEEFNRIKSLEEEVETLKRELENLRKKLIKD